MVRSSKTLEGAAANWREAYARYKTAELTLELAKSAWQSAADETGADIVATKNHGHIVKQEQRGQVDYKALAIKYLGDPQVSSVAEDFRRRTTSSWTAPSSWGVK